MATIDQKPDNTGVALAIAITISLFFILIFCASCRVRKVNTEISKSETKVKTEQSSKVTEATTEYVVDKSVTKKEVTEKIETFETDSSTVTADKITFENGKIKEAIGNVKIKNKVNTRRKKDIQSTGLKQADKVTNTTFDKDSVGDFSSDSTNKTKDKVKEVEVKSTSWVLIGVLVVLVLGVMAWFKFVKK